MSYILQISCTLQHYFPETVENLKKLCISAGINSPVNDSMTCCGMPYFDKGEFKTAKKVAENYLAAIGEANIITSSLKCEQVMTVKYPKIFNNTVSHIQCMRIAGNTKGLKDIFSKAQLNNTNAATGEFYVMADCDAPATLQKEWLAVFKNAVFHYPSLENTCCGAGYCLPALNKDTAGKMSLTILNEAKESGAHAILAFNDICMVQLQSTARKNNIDIPIVHIIDFFAKAL